MGPQRLICLKYYNVLKWENRFIFGLATLLKILIVSKPTPNKSCLALNFLQKSQWEYMSTSLGVELGAQRFICLKYYNIPTE